MPINLMKYQGRYVKVLYGPNGLTGKLVGNRLLVYTLGGDVVETWELNEGSIDAIADVTSSSYRDLCVTAKEMRFEYPLQRELGNILGPAETQRIKSEIE